MRLTRVIGLVALCLVVGSATVARADGAIRTTLQAVGLRASGGLRSSSAGWLAGVAVQPRDGWPYLDVSMGRVPMPSFSDDLGVLRIGATYAISMLDWGRHAAGLEVLVSGGFQSTRFPSRYEAPLGAPAPAPGEVTAGPIYPQWTSAHSSYAGATLGLAVAVGDAGRLSLDAGVAGAFVDGPAYVYPSVGVAFTVHMTSW